MIIWYAYVETDNEITMLSSQPVAKEGWLALPSGWVHPPRASHVPPGPTPDKLVWDATTETVSVVTR